MKFRSGNRFIWGEHFALDDEYLSHWTNSTETSASERETIRSRVRASLHFLNIAHSVDIPGGGVVEVADCEVNCAGHS